MCGRFAFYSPHEAVVRLFGVPAGSPEFEPRYNIAPTTFVTTVRVLPDDNGTRRLAMLCWGLVPSWAKDRSTGARMNNARAETLREKPSFRNAYRKRRCLVLADGYYEWQRSAAAKRPYFIQLASVEPFAMAGLWEAWRDPANGDTLESCTLVTTAPVSSIAHIHDRMPVILPQGAYDEWLDPGNGNVESLDRLLTSDPALAVTARPVSRLVNDVRNQGPRLIEPIDDEPAARGSNDRGDPGAGQGTLPF